MDFQQILLRDNAFLRRHMQGNFSPRSIYSVSSHMSATDHMFFCSSHSTESICYDSWHMRNLDSIGPDGNLLPEPLTCQELCVVKLFDRIRTAGKDIEWFCCINFALICTFNSSMSWLQCI
jgi:hypothetical protein